LALVDRVAYFSTAGTLLDLLCLHLGQLDVFFVGASNMLCKLASESILVSFSATPPHLA
jgi:hypothetical protein